MIAVKTPSFGVDTSTRLDVRLLLICRLTGVDVCIFCVVKLPTLTSASAFAASVWINDQFINTTFDGAGISETDQVYTFPNNSVVAGQDNVITIVQVSACRRFPAHSFHKFLRTIWAMMRVTKPSRLVGSEVSN